MTRGRHISTHVKLVLIAVAIAAVATSAYAVSLGRIIGGVAIGTLVDASSSQLNSFINTMTLNQDLGVDVDTKVVPIISVGSGAYVGAAQVIGPRDAVNQTQAVAQVEGSMSRFRAKALVPVSSRTGTLNRVRGVGIGAVIDVSI